MKVNAKLKRFLVTCLILAGGYIVCGFLYVFLDQILNGFMREWIERNFIYTEWMALGDADVDGYFTQTINWGNLKRKLFAALIILIVAVVLIVRLVSVCLQTGESGYAGCGPDD